jgi:hypothetical protein
LDGGLWIVVDHDEVGPVSIAAVRQGCDEARELGSNTANAHLIAAAPEMFEALERAEQFMRAAIANLDNRAIQGNLANSRSSLDIVRAVKKAISFEEASIEAAP